MLESSLRTRCGSGASPLSLLRHLSPPRPSPPLPTRIPLTPPNNNRAQLYYETPEGEAEWFSKDKPSLPLGPFPNLPYFIDGPVRLTQSLAILRYVGGKAGLVPADPVQASAMDVALYQVVDFRRQLSGHCYSNAPTWETLRDKDLPASLKAFDAALVAAGGAWIAGASLTIADFTLYEGIEQARLMLRERAGDAAFSASYPAVTAFQARFEALPAVAAYMASPEFIKRPFNGFEASWK
jgi:glutathione S-transferase